MGSMYEYVRCTHFPYCIERQENGSYVILNRFYKPLGFSTKHGDYLTFSDYPIEVFFRDLTPKIASKISWENKQDLNQIFLYSDGCIPTRTSDNMKNYLNRLSHLMRLSQKTLEIRKEENRLEYIRNFKTKYLPKIREEVKKLKEKNSEVSYD